MDSGTCAVDNAVLLALAAAPDRALSYGDPRGQPELRAALAAYLRRARGVSARFSSGPPIGFR